MQMPFDPNRPWQAELVVRPGLLLALIEPATSLLAWLYYPLRGGHLQLCRVRGGTQSSCQVAAVAGEGASDNASRQRLASELQVLVLGARTARHSTDSSSW